MHEYIVRSARERPDVCGVRLYVEAENIVAQTAYKRMGMSASHYRSMNETLFSIRHEGA